MRRVTAVTVRRTFPSASANVRTTTRPPASASSKEPVRETVSRRPETLSTRDHAPDAASWTNVSSRIVFAWRLVFVTRTAGRPSTAAGTSRHVCSSRPVGVTWSVVWTTAVSAPSAAERVTVRPRTPEPTTARVPSARKVSTTCERSCDSSVSEASVNGAGASSVQYRKLSTLPFSGEPPGMRNCSFDPSAEIDGPSSASQSPSVQPPAHEPHASENGSVSPGSGSTPSAAQKCRSVPDQTVSPPTRTVPCATEEASVTTSAPMQSGTRCGGMPAKRMSAVQRQGHAPVASCVHVRRRQSESSGKRSGSAYAPVAESWTSGRTFPRSRQKISGARTKRSCRREVPAEPAVRADAASSGPGACGSG